MSRTATKRRTYRFTPSVGPWHVELSRLVRCLAAPSDSTLQHLDDEVDSIVREATRATPDSISLPSVNRLRFGYTLALILDVLRAGGEARVIDSELYLSWPDWHSAAGREATQHALSRLVEHRPPTTQERTRLGRLLAPDMDAVSLVRFLTEGHFWLESGNAEHPSGVLYGEAFSFALRVWTMPYRGRQGRMRRYVVVGTHPVISPEPVLVGLIELGDEGPFSTGRDRFLRLLPAEFLTWFEEQADRASLARVLATRYRKMRAAIREVPTLDPNTPVAKVLASEAQLRELARGRSQTALREHFVPKKSLAYLLRLAQGEFLFGRLAAGETIQATDPQLREAVRAFHDLIVPRVHMEVTVCGAVPPFSVALGGKLVVAFLAHPEILDVTKDSRGTVIEQVFNRKTLERFLPKWGALVLTTKGLYPFHSALYNRAELPGIHRPTRLTKIGETSGTTTTLLQERTGRLARLLLDYAKSARPVSLAYGSGGAKRQRTIESAVLALGLPETLVHAGIRRPIYGVPMADNIGRVIWADETPNWTVPRDVTPEAYCQQAVDLWRRRWLPNVMRRLNSPERSVPGVMSTVSQCGIMSDECP